MNPEEYKAHLLVLEMAIADKDQWQAGLTLRKILLYENPLYADAVSLILGVGGSARKEKSDVVRQMPIKLHLPTPPASPASIGEAEPHSCLDILSESGATFEETLDRVIAEHVPQVPDPERVSKTPPGGYAIPDRFIPPSSPELLSGRDAKRLLSIQLIPEYVMFELNGFFTGLIRLELVFIWASGVPRYSWMFDEDGRVLSKVQDRCHAGLKLLTMGHEMRRGSTKGHYYIAERYIPIYQERGMALVGDRQKEL